jgi:hypothetical protein
MHRNRAARGLAQFIRSAGTIGLVVSTSATAFAAVTQAFASTVTGCGSAPYGVHRYAPGSGKTVALTFDDGPGPSPPQSPGFSPPHTLGWQGTRAGITVTTIVARVLAGAQPGEIVLMHVGASSAISRSTPGSSGSASAASAGLPRSAASAYWVRPAVALKAAAFAPHVDFFSVGTNDVPCRPARDQRVADGRCRSSGPWYDLRLWRRTHHGASLKVSSERGDGDDRPVQLLGAGR